MMNKRPILGNGEVYTGDVERSVSGGEKHYPKSYLEAKSKLINDLKQVYNQIKLNNEIFLDEKVLCVRMEPKFEAKSYVPSLLVNKEMKLVGGKKYKTSNDQDAKLYFVRSSDNGINSLLSTLETGLKDNNDTWKRQIRGICKIDLLSHEEKLSGFDPDWDGGYVEIVLHPMNSLNQESINTLKKILENDSLNSSTDKKYQISEYQNGPTFCSLRCTKDDLYNLTRLNTLRTIHPLKGMNIPDLRSSIKMQAPIPPQFKGKSNVKVGVFDGGAKSDIPLLHNFIKVEDLTQLPPCDSYIAHGTGVCGAVLYGPLNYKSSNEILDHPLVNVVSFRVFPEPLTGDSIQDSNLYTVIDMIEDTVKTRDDIHIYNLSFGPCGAIIDDDISRFTYALDKLTNLDHHPIFCIAAGNEGTLQNPLNRIQSPSDLVNGLGVGAYTFNYDNQKTKADYSCVGPGREGCKTKPDILEFGGSKEHPFILVDTNENKTTSGAGTSFASPVVAGKIGKMVALSDQITPHIARTLLIHTAENDKSIDREKIGFGYCQQNIEDIINCTDNSVLILYSGRILPTKNIKLPILIPVLQEKKGNVKIKWTITTIAEPNPNDVDSYTSHCIEDFFYPDSTHYSYHQKGPDKKILNTQKAHLGSAEEAEYLSKGYTRSILPISKPATQFLSEAALKNQNLKWDTVVKKEKTMRANNLNDPFLVLHCLSRADLENKSLQYHVAISVDFPNYTNMYDDIIRMYPDLTPIEVRSQDQIIIRV